MERIVPQQRAPVEWGHVTQQQALLRLSKRVAVHAHCHLRVPGGVGQWLEVCSVLTQPCMCWRGGAQACVRALPRTSALAPSSEM